MDGTRNIAYVLIEGLKTPHNIIRKTKCKYSGKPFFGTIYLHKDVNVDFHYVDIS
jgi:hypothetical protein